MTSPKTFRARMAGAARLAGAVVGVAVPPVLLARVIGNPLPSWPVDWTGVAETVRAGLIPSTVWVDVLGVMAWLTWTVLLAMLLVEVVAVVRDRPSPSAVPVWVRRLAQVLVSATLALTGPAPPAASVAGERLMVAAASPAHSVSPTQSPTVVPADAGRTVTVGEGDSWAGFAADVLGDSALGRQLREANLGRIMEDGTEITEATAFVEPGWRLLIPADLDQTPYPAPSPSATEPDVDAGTAAVEAEIDESDGRLVEVQAGDNFWKIAEDTLTDAWDRAPAVVEVAGYWTDLIDVNRDRLLPPGDPDLIHPGQTFITPPAPVAPETSATAPDEAAIEPTDEAAPEPMSGRPIAGGDASTGERDPARTPTTGDAEVAPKVAGGDSHAETDADDAVESDEDDPKQNTPWGVSPHLPAGLAASGLFAAGVTAIVRTRRRHLLASRQLGMRLPTPAPEAVHELGRLAAAAPPEKTLDDLTSLLCSTPEHVHPTVVVTLDDGTVEVLFDDTTPVPEPVSPWTLLDHGDGPVGWSAAIGDQAPARSYGLPLLVTAGKADNRILHINIAAIGRLTVSGPDEDVSRSLHRMTMEVGASPVSGPVEVAVVGDRRLADWYRVRQIDDATIVVKQATDEAQHISVHDRLPRLLVCHPGTPIPDLPVKTDGMLGMIVATRTDPAPWELALQPDGTGRLHLPDGATVDLDLPDVDTDLLESEIATLRPHRMVTEDGTAAAPAVPSQEGTEDGHRLPDAPAAASPEVPGPVSVTAEDTPWCDVRILGPVQVVRDGEQLDDVRGLPLQVLTYLVTHPDGVTPGQLEADVWDLPDAKGSQRAKAALIRLRRMLGDGPDGEPLVPNRSPGDRLLVLSKHVGCDADRALAHLDKAKHLTNDERQRELSVALALVRGEPFQDLPMSWTTVYGQQLIARLQDAALEIAAACRDVESFDAAEDAIQRALSLCPYTEALYEEWARVVTKRGHFEQVSKIKDQFCRQLGSDVDDVDTAAIDEAAVSQQSG